MKGGKKELKERRKEIGRKEGRKAHAHCTSPRLPADVAAGE